MNIHLSFRVQIGLELRQLWLINGILFDKYLLKGLISAHDKTPVKHLYLETAALPIPYILVSRRVIYLKNILDRENEEITKQAYQCQLKNPVPGDLCEQVKRKTRLQPNLNAFE